MKSNPQAIRARRERAGHTTTTLADAAGVSARRLRAFEDDETELLPTTARKLADALGCDIPDICTDLIDVPTTG